jgi:hypothetical protein
MAVSDWSTTASNNTTLEGINVAEGCPAGNINGVIRAMAAALRTFYNSVPDASTLMAKAGGIFTGDITRNGRGAYLHHNSTSNASGKIFVQASGGAIPSMSNGDILMEY